MDVDELKKKIMPIYRIIVLGAKQVGKTSLINQFVNNSFDAFYESTENDIRRYIKVHDLSRGEGDASYVMFEIEDM